MATLDTLAVFDALASRADAAPRPALDVTGGHAVLAFDEAADQTTQFQGVLPACYAGGDLRLVVTWAPASGASGEVVWQAAFERHAIADATHGTFDLDEESFGSSVAVASSAATAPGQLIQTEIAVTALEALNPEAGESYRLRLTRLGSDSQDTLAGDAQLLSLEVREG